MASGKTDLHSAVTCQSEIVKNESRECCKTDETLYNEVLNWYKVENFSCNKDVTKSETNKRASEVLESTVESKEGRYHVGLLWKKDPTAFTVRFRTIMKDVWRLGKQCDNLLPNSFDAILKSLMREIRNFSSVEIPRFLFEEKKTLKN